jgi:hypothetical protein
MIHPYRMPGSDRFYLVEILELNDASRSGLIKWTHIAEWFRDAYSKRLLFRGIIYLLRISDSRISGSVVKSLRLSEHICRENNFANVAPATTMWDSVDLGVAPSREKELVFSFWNHMMVKGAKKMQQDANWESAVAIIARLMRQRPMALLQTQLIDESLSFSATGVGQNLF